MKRFVIALLFTFLLLAPATEALELPGDIFVRDIRFTVEHDGFDTASSFMEISGTGLDGVTVRFEKSGLGGGFQTLGTLEESEDTFLKYTFTAEETRDLTGRFNIAGTIFSLELGSFPNLNGADRVNVNVDLYNDDDLDPNNYFTLSGNYLDLIGQGDVTAEYGRIQTREFTPTDPNEVSPDGTSLKLYQPLPAQSYGYQNIRISKITEDETDDLVTTVEYIYADAFRFVQNLDLENLRVFPNTGAKGDPATITADNFNDQKNYRAYFLRSLDGTDVYSDVNAAETVSLEINRDTGEGRLNILVPDHVDFGLGTYYIVLTEIQSGEIIAEQRILNDEDEPEPFLVIDASFRPTIERLLPPEGPDTGGDVQIEGRNLLSLNIPNLSVENGGEIIVDQLSGDEILTIPYENGFYDGKEVTIERTMTVQIGKPVRFLKNNLGDYIYTQGTPDSFLIRTPIIDDAETDPLKDVLIELTTTLVETETGETYTFVQSVTREDGYRYIPSTITPVITDVVPELIQVIDFDPGYRLKEETLLVVKGDDFLVDRVVNEEGQSLTRKPNVLIKKNSNNTQNSVFQIGFFPNETVVDGDREITGVVRIKSEESTSGFGEILRDEEGNVIPLQMTVLDDAGNTVTGITGNDVGSKIVFRMPIDLTIADLGIRHVQVTNPRRESDLVGAATLYTNALEFLTTIDIPVIETVDPNITTIDGGEEVRVIGSNFQEGLRLYLDGEEITDFTREIDPTGANIILTFTAPPGREGTTQLQVVNPSGGLAVADFTYVNSFNKDPVFESFQPKQGTQGTLVVINGDNYLRPDPTALGTTGFDGFKLIGTRVFLDGRDVNDYHYDSYGNIDFRSYTVPGAMPALRRDGDAAAFTVFANNTYALDGEGTYFILDRDRFERPKLTDGNTDEVIFGHDGTNFVAYDGEGTLLGTVTQAFNASEGITTLTLSNGRQFKLYTDNAPVRVVETAGGLLEAAVADYVESTILDDGTSYFTLRVNTAEEIVLENGRDRSYTIYYSDGLKARESGGGVLSVSSDDTALIVGGTRFELLTPYRIDTETGKIVGDRTRVINRNQVSFFVPGLTTGKGYKDIAVVNPDTKSDGEIGEGADRFYYITQASSNPVIERIVPDFGSVDGGYTVRIDGNDFEDDMRVYVDSVPVPLANTNVSIDGTSVTIRMPASIKDLAGDFGVDRLAVPVVVLNPDGGSDYREKGFTYIIPVSEPEIRQIIPVSGSANGGDIVEIIGYEFRFYEPYTNLVGGDRYDVGDPFTDLFRNGEWDDLLAAGVDPDAIWRLPETMNPYYEDYYESPVLPDVFFGDQQAKIVEYGNGYLKVITPPGQGGAVEVYVVNNDSGISNKVTYRYETSNPRITNINPNFGRRQGQEIKDIYGSEFFRKELRGYTADTDDEIVILEDLEADVRFGTIDNRGIDRTLPNSGLINNGRTEVNLEGGLKVSYNGLDGTVAFFLEENNRIYSRTFSGYDNEPTLFPMGMLRDQTGRYYVPNGLDSYTGETYTGEAFEYVKLQIEDRRLIVERGYAPEVTYDNQMHLSVLTPSYYTIGTVTVTVTNRDGGQGATSFRYTYPASEPKIHIVKPAVLSVDESEWWVEGSINAALEIEIIGKDFRNNAKVFIGERQAEVIELTTTVIGGEVFDSLVAKVPTTGETDIDRKYPVIVQNEDFGLANSATLDNLYGPNYGEDETLRIYYVYRKPLSNPEITNISPAETSVYGGNLVTITGKDFREGAYVIIGSRNGVPVTDVQIHDRGSVLTFRTPKNLTLGEKNVQVYNNDYGVAIAEASLTVVSYPQVESTIYDEIEDNIKTRISVEGGEVITLKGEQFIDGASVYFGGDRVRANDDTGAENAGLWRNDDYYLIEEGFRSPTVEVVNSTTLRVTVPPITAEGEVFITVINGDGGISDGDVTIDYRVPVPSDPVNLKVELLDDSIIRLYDYYAESVLYYEIYTYIGSKSTIELRRNHYRDFGYLDSTELEPYKITKLKGVEDVEAGEKVYFVLKAVNKYGPSGWSNIAYLTSKDVEDVERIGPEDVDGGTDVAEDQTHEIVSGVTSDEVLLSPGTLPANLGIELTTVAYEQKDHKITVPANQVKTNRSLILVDYGRVRLNFTPLALNTQVFRNLEARDRTYGQIVHRSVKDDFASVMMGSLPRGERAVGQLYRVDYYAVTNATSTPMGMLSTPVYFTFDVASHRLTMQERIDLDLKTYDGSRWVSVPFQMSGERMTTAVQTPGYYLITTKR